MRLTPDVKELLFVVPDEWIVQNPLWELLAPEVVELARRRIAARERLTTPTSAST